MALSDCIKCWDTPCTCGEYWKDYSHEKKLKQCKAIMGKKIYTKEEVIDIIYKSSFVLSNGDTTKEHADDWINKNL